MRPTVYLETTIVSYLAARPSRDLVVAAHQRITWEWWEEHSRSCALHVSQVVLDEAAEGDAEAAGTRLGLLQGIPLLGVDEQVVELAQAFIREGTMPGKAERDALHVAVATVHHMDVLLTWNCSHIANVHVCRRIAETCRKTGYAAPAVCTPEGVMGDPDVERPDR